MQSVRTRALVVLYPSIAAIACIVTGIDGTLGKWHDFQLLADIRRAFEIGKVSRSTDAFPLIRDVPSWILVTIMISTCLFVHAQWRLFSTCVNDLISSSVLVEKPNPSFSRTQRIFLMHRSGGTGAPTYLTHITRINNGCKRAGKYTFILLAVAIGLMLLLVIGENHSGMFRVLLPHGESGKTATAFGISTYNNWWASFRHAAGFLLYIAVGALGVFVILLQNVVGVFAAYLVGGLGSFFEMKVDWFDADGGYGWKALGRSYRTVRWSLVLHGLAISLLLAIVGIEVWRWLLTLVSLWLVALPLYVGMPTIVFRRVRYRAGSQALDAVRTESHKLSIGAQMAAAASVVPFVRQARIHPMRLSRFGVYAFFITILLPIVLTAAQIFASVKFGPHP